MFRRRLLERRDLEKILGRRTYSRNSRNVYPKNRTRKRLTIDIDDDCVRCGEDILPY